MEGTRLHPVWKEVALKIKQRVEVEGYGFTISLDDLYQMLDIVKPGDDVPYGEAKKSAFLFLERVEALKDECLGEFNIALMSQRSVGYRVMPPAEQIDGGWQHYQDKARKHLKKALKMTTNVNVEMLDQEARNLRDRHLGLTVFTLRGMDKRKLARVVIRDQIEQGPADKE